MVIEKFGKSTKGLFDIKKSFFDNNELHLKEQLRINKIYVQQPIRTACKNCAAPIDGHDFRSHDVSYKACDNCGHLNGMHQETDDFFRQVYHQDAGESYGRVYSEQDTQAFKNRVERIYTPKADFLFQILQQQGLDPLKLSYCDFGAGSGYFVAALHAKGASVVGYEVSEYQVQLGNKILGQSLMQTFSPEATYQLLSDLKCDVLNLIGVLEHLPDPRLALQAIKKNQHIKYTYFSLPLFSSAVFFEILFQKSYNRQLGGGHTHLYTEKSIQHFVKEFQFKHLAHWYFGTDFMDLYRHGLTEFKNNGVSDTGLKLFEENLGQHIDALQLVLDQQKKASEVHFVLQN